MNRPFTNSRVPAIAASLLLIGVFAFVLLYDESPDADTAIDTMVSFQGESNAIEQEAVVRNVDLSSAQVLVFGDSITDSTLVGYTNDKTDNGRTLGNQTTSSYSWRTVEESAKSYIKDGKTIRFFHWPRLLKNAVDFKEIRCYAKSGAYWHTVTRPAGDDNWKPLLNVQCQIDLAINDCNAKNTIVGNADFNPNIVIFALGTNDILQPQNVGSFESAKAKTVYTDTMHNGVDVDATIAALDDTNSHEANPTGDSSSIGSAMKAFLRIKRAFPYAQIYVVLPLLRTRYDFNQGSFRTEMIKMANYYNAIIVDGTYESGISRDFEVSNEVGVYTIDGLHPNEVGQNMLARLILEKLRCNYTPLYQPGFNPEGGYPQS